MFELSLDAYQISFHLFIVIIHGDTCYAATDDVVVDDDDDDANASDDNGNANSPLFFIFV